MNSREEGGRNKSLSSLLFKIPALQAERENDLGVNCFGAEVLHDNGTGERVSGPPAIYTRQIMQSGFSHSCPDWDDARGVGEGTIPGRGVSF